MADLSGSNLGAAKATTPLPPQCLHHTILYTYIKLGGVETFCDSFEKTIRGSKIDLQTVQFNEHAIILPILIGGLTKMVVIRSNTRTYRAT